MRLGYNGIHAEGCGLADWQAQLDKRCIMARTFGRWVVASVGLAFASCSGGGGEPGGLTDEQTVSQGAKGHGGPAKGDGPSGIPKPDPNTIIRRLGPGERCDVGFGVCEPGLTCADGVCCTSRCDGLCERCDLEQASSGIGQEPWITGNCTPIEAGQDPDGECPSGSACNGHGACFGAHLWSQRFGDSSWQSSSAIAVDSSDNALVTGEFFGTVNFGGDDLPSAGGFDIFVAKLDADGNHLWSQRFGDSSDQHSWDIAVDNSGDALVTGPFQGTVNFGGDDFVSAGSWDIFVAKLDANGNHLWSQHFGDSSDQSSYAIATDSSDNEIVTGGFDGKVNFGGEDLSSAGSWDIFVAKLDTAGNHLWSQRFGDSSDQSSSAIAVDSSDNAMVTGSFEGTINFGGDDLSSTGGYDVFVVNLDAVGNHLRSQRFGDSNDQYSWTIAVDSSDNALVAGPFQGTINFGGSDLPSAGSWDIFVAKLDANANHLWSQRFGDESDQHSWAIAVDSSDNALVAGPFQGTVNFGGDDLVSAGYYDVFVAKLAP